MAEDSRLIREAGVDFVVTVAWCGERPGRVDRGMAVRGRLFVIDDRATRASMEALRERIVSTLDHKPLSEDQVFSYRQAADTIARQVLAFVPEGCAAGLELEIAPGIWWRYTTEGMHCRT